jgi:hypothetical protein
VHRSVDAVNCLARATYGGSVWPLRQPEEYLLAILWVREVPIKTARSTLLLRSRRLTLLVGLARGRQHRIIHVNRVQLQRFTCLVS